MEAQAFAVIAIQASILLLAFALGLQASFSNATTLFRELFRRPHRLLRAVISMYVIVPAAALVVALAFDLPHAVRAGLLAMAIAPIPPILPRTQLKFGGSADHVFGLLVAMSISSIVLVPAALHAIGAALGQSLHFSPARVAGLIASTVLLPLLPGLIVRAFAPQLAASWAPWISRCGTALLIVAAFGLVIGAAPDIVALIRDGTVAAVATLVFVSLLIGHALGGPDDDDKPTLAIASSMRHPGVALAIATSNAPAAGMVGATILTCLLVSAILTTLYGVLYVTSRRRKPR